jgi:hypothetical protein
MITIQRTNDWKFILENNNITIRTMFDNWKIWLTKKEISDIYWVKKSNIKKELNNLIVNSQLKTKDIVKKIYNSKRDKTETFYSLDILLLLGYKSKHFKETKLLINTNNLIKEYTSSRKHRLNNFYSNQIINKIINYFDPVLKII